VAVSAHFYPVPYPESRLFLAACVGIYFIIQTVLQAMENYLDGDLILITQPKQATVGKQIQVLPGLCLRSSLIRYATDYSLMLHHRNPSQAFKPADRSLEHRKALQITEFFDTDGVFLHEQFADAVGVFFTEFEAKVAAHNKTDGKKKQ